MMTTPNRQSFLLIPSSNDPVGLVEVLTNDNDEIEEEIKEDEEEEQDEECAYSDQVVKFNESGDSLLKLVDDNARRVRAGETVVHVVVIFDAFVEPPPIEFCRHNTCDWPIMPDELQKGIHLPEKLRARHQAKVIYPDGTAQIVYPTVLQPNLFKSLISELDGIEKVVYQFDGSFKAVYFGQPVSIYPTFDTYLTQLGDAETEIEPTVNLIGAGKFSYTVQDCSRLVTTSLVIE